MSDQPLVGPLGLAVCPECHAVVNREAFDLHMEWHAGIDCVLAALNARTREVRS